MFTLDERLQEQWQWRLDRFKPVMTVKPLSDTAILAYVEQWEKAKKLEPTSYLYYRNVQSYHDPDKFYIELKEGNYPPAEAAE